MTDKVKEVQKTIGERILAEIVPVVEKPELLTIATLREKFLDQMTTVETVPPDWEVAGATKAWVVLTDGKAYVRINRTDFLFWVEERLHRGSGLVGDTLSRMTAEAMKQLPQLFLE